MQLQRGVTITVRPGLMLPCLVISLRDPPEEEEEGGGIAPIGLALDLNLNQELRYH